MRNDDSTPPPASRPGQSPRDTVLAHLRWLARRCQDVSVSTDARYFRVLGDLLTCVDGVLSDTRDELVLLAAVGVFAHRGLDAQLFGRFRVPR